MNHTCFAYVGPSVIFSPSLLRSSDLLTTIKRLHFFAPRADIPSSVGTHSAMRIITPVNRHVHERKSVMLVSPAQGSLETLLRVASFHCEYPTNRTRKAHEINRYIVASSKCLAVLRCLETRNRSHSSVIKDHNHSSCAMDNPVYKDLRIHHERAVPCKGYQVMTTIGYSGSEQRTDREAHIGRTGFRECLSGTFVLNDLEAVSLYVACVEYLDRLH